MKVISLTQGKVALVDDVDYAWLSRFKWYANKCTLKTRVIWYAMRTTSRNVRPRRTFLMHREIAAVDGLLDVDHHDGDGLNNQRYNLRPATRSQNFQNRRKEPGKTSEFKGVSWHRRAQKWTVQIGVNGQHKYLGLFEDEVEAARVYDRAAEQYFGEFALTNNI
jgi:hypothetical protein